MADLPESTCRNTNVVSRDIPIDVSGDDSNCADYSGCSSDMPDVEIVTEDDKSSSASGLWLDKTCMLKHLLLP
ncbi:hypothetical protein GOBAR_AA36206 [Gossypium barbadense]|uniref:Uncharacterized protein n=1 Tax=Gossypium barbadense TaxID=3634 RepID=A0A2P5W083_GOSBA|nr:hypothetical protein GOBAR_AA36206 [Gossypium barbadense]